MSGLRAEIHGLVELQKKTDQVVEDLHGKPMLDAMRDAVVNISNDVKVLSPVDTGRGRASVTPEVRIDGPNVIGVVGSNVKHMLFMEVGTKPHWPPISALEGWARRHGTSAYVIARAIAMHGTKPRQMFQQAAEKNEKRVVALLNKAVGRIVDQ